jgi:4-alpha-glucanotransferase
MRDVGAPQASTVRFEHDARKIEFACVLAACRRLTTARRTRHEARMRRAAGILLHPTSLPDGQLGADARRFVDWTKRAGLSAWQMLPLVPTGGGGSPYSSVSALGLNPALTPKDIAHPSERELDRYEQESPWASELALFLALQAAHDGAPFWLWPDALRLRERQALVAARQMHATHVHAHLVAQYRAEQAWRSLKRYANDQGVALIGDVPIYVDQNSVDVWCEPEAFLLDDKSRPLAVSGVPPDYFSETGQLWGNPLYDWNALAKNGHAFWVRRMKRAFELFDTLRIDHFRAFAAYWSVPADAPDARAGRWEKGPGAALFSDMKRALGDLPLIAEDLGTLDDEVHALRDTLALPGMAILQFAFGDDAKNPYLPHNHQKQQVVYTGTHDNDTTLGFWRSADEKTRDHVRRYFGVDGHDIVWDFIRAAFASVADLAILPMQDVLALGTEARMNTPGVADGNWGWKMRGDAFDDAVARRLSELCTLYFR